MPAILVAAIATLLQEALRSSNGGVHAQFFRHRTANSRFSARGESCNDRRALTSWVGVGGWDI